jgi:tRNA(adenine34) deaminase
MNEDEKWMNIAILQAIKAKEKNEVPVGAILVKNDVLIAKAHNETILKNDASAHAEIQLIRTTGEIFKNYRLLESVVYVTLEPCAMCLSAMMHARISRIVFGAYDPKTGVCGTCSDLTKAKFFNHNIKITGGVLEAQSSQLLVDFFKKRRY